jgi:hypothetical protein
MNEHEDAQRAMEQRALRNVRGLVDKIEETDRREGAAQKRLLLGVVALIVLALIAVVVFLPRREAVTSTVTPGKPAPAQAPAPR